MFLIVALLTGCEGGAEDRSSDVTASAREAANGETSGPTEATFLKLGMTKQEVLAALDAQGALPADKVAKLQRVAGGCLIRPSDEALKTDPWRVDRLGPSVVGNVTVWELYFVNGNLHHVEAFRLP